LLVGAQLSRLPMTARGTGRKPCNLLCSKPRAMRVQISLGPDKKMQNSRTPGGNTMRRLLLVAVAAAAALFSAALYAQNYPTRPVTMVAVFGPGSASDTICRIIANELGPALGQPVIVEDRPGADGALAALYVHHQLADGYTLMMATNSPLSADP